MTFRKIRNAMVLAGLAVVFISAPAWANEEVLPAPGVLGLVTIGIIGAIALSRLRK